MFLKFHLYIPFTIFLILKINEESSKFVFEGGETVAVICYS